MFTTGSAHYASRPKLVCCICSKPVALEVSKTDERGNAVHEECYVRKTISKFKRDDSLRLSDDWLSTFSAQFQLALSLN
jgi:hypothetical protein